MTLQAALKVREAIRLVALDLDGTVLDEQLQISPRVIAAVRGAITAGVQVTLATGRGFRPSLPFAHILGITAPLITYQGGEIVQTGSGEILYRATLAPELAHEAVARAEAEDLDISLYVDDCVYFRALRRPQVFYDRWFGLTIRQAPDLHAVIDRSAPVKFIVIAEPTEADVIEAHWKAVFQDRLHIVRSHRLFVEGNPVGISKGTALEWLAAREGVPQSAVMAIGDNDNDRSMIEWAALGIGMGNCSPGLREVADWIAPSLAEDGVAVALERFVLGRS